MNKELDCPVDARDGRIASRHQHRMSSYIYYETSEYEEIVGGYKKSNYFGYEDPNPDKTPDNDKSVTADPDVEGVRTSLRG